MAQANSVQREPSMEEILASIRRIIEDNDTGRRPAVDFGQVRPEPEDGERNVIEVEAFRAELQSSKVAAPVAEKRVELAPTSGLKIEPTPVEAKSVEPKPIEARPLEQAVEADNAPWPTIEPKRVAAVEVKAPVAEAVVAPRTAQSWTPSSTLAVEQMERLAGPARQPASAPIAPVEVAAQVQPVEAAVVDAAAKPAILSEQAGRQISAAFGELNDAYAARSRKSFDEIATDMLRPMLQDWLDNNLPTLVERLVREEIERVARGGQ